MKILFLTHYDTLYGANRSLLNLIDDLRERYDISPVLLSTAGYNQDSELSDACAKMNIRLIHARYYSWQSSIHEKKIKSLCKIILNFFLKYRIIFIVGAENPDVIHSNSSVINVGQIVAQKLGIPHIWHFREFGKKDYAIDYFYPKWYVKSQIEKANSVIAISKVIKNYVVALSPSANVSLIYNGVDDAEQKKVDQENHDHNQIQFCCVGALSPQKNQIEVLRAAKILIDEGIHNFQVNIVGAGSKQETNMLKSFCNERNLQRNVTFWGYRQDVMQILTGMDVGLVPSIAEAFGRVTVEYMFAQLPVIGSDAGGNVEIIVKDKTGLFYHLGDARSLADKMKYFCTHQNKAKKMGIEGQKRARLLFSKAQNTDKVYLNYSQVMKGTTK